MNEEATKEIQQQRKRLNPVTRDSSIRHGREQGLFDKPVKPLQREPKRCNSNMDMECPFNAIVWIAGKCYKGDEKCKLGCAGADEDKMERGGRLH